MKKTFRLFLAALVALSFVGCIYVVDPEEGNNNSSNSSNSTNTENSSEEGKTSDADPYISFVFDPQPAEDEYVQVNIHPSDKFVYYAWGVVKTSETKAFSSVEEYVKTYVKEAIDNGATYAGWKHDGKITCSDVGWTLHFEPGIEYCIYAFQVSGEKLAVYGHVASHKYTLAAKNEPEEKQAPDGYLDMGLPSKTHWYYNTTGWWDYYTYNELNNIIPEHAQGGAIPSEEQWNELRQYCKWEWDGAGFEISNTKNSKMSFYLPFIGAYNEGGEKVDDETHGYYWTRTLDGNQVSMAVITNDGVIDFQKVSATGGWKMSGIFVWKP